jgi:hypothetical protein
MNTKTQLDFHPDADTLSAFAERVLAKKEHGEITAHLAICGRCRQVVFLAQEAAIQDEERASVGVKKVDYPRHWWSRKWVFVWAPAAAMAMAFIPALYLHLKRTESAVEIAKSSQESSPLAMSRGGADATTATQVSPASGVASVATEGAPNRQPAAPITPFDSARRTANGKLVNGETERVPSPPAPIGISPKAAGAVDEFKAQPVETAETSDTMRAEVLTQEQASLKATQGSQTETEQQRNESAEKGAQQVSVQASPPPAGFAAGIRTTRALALNAPKASALPTGLPAISTVKGVRLALAVDDSGNVFLSRDSGIHWESVARQWSGRAVTVRLQSTPPECYELVNDQGQKWASPDGLVWTAE